LHEIFVERGLKRVDIDGVETEGSCRNELKSVVPDGYSCGCPTGLDPVLGTLWGTKGGTLDGLDPLFGGSGCIPENFERLQFRCSASESESDLQGIVAGVSGGTTGYYLQSRQCSTDASVVN
jgi:hypothetical protein